MFNIIVVILSLLVSLSVCAEIADPTRPLGASGAVVGAGAGDAQSGITLTSVLISGERKVAIINGQLLQELQTVKGVGAVVKRIDADGVTLQQGNKTWRVALNKTAVRK